MPHTHNDLNSVTTIDHTGPPFMAITLLWKRFSRVVCSSEARVVFLGRMSYRRSVSLTLSIGSVLGSSLTRQYTSSCQTQTITFIQQLSDTAHYFHPIAVRHSPSLQPNSCQTQPITSTQQLSDTAHHFHPTTVRHRPSLSSNSCQTQPITFTQ